MTSSAVDAHQRPIDAREHLQHAREACEALLGQAAGAPQECIFQRALHGGHEPLGIGLQYVVGRAALQGLDRALLADRAGEKDEGNVGRHLAGDGERGHAVELRQAEIRQDDVREHRGERGAHLPLVHHTLMGADVAGLLETPDGELGVGLGILDEQHAQFARCRGSGHVGLHGTAIRAPGYGWHAGCKSHSSGC
jgi:hypothetical protein